MSDKIKKYRVYIFEALLFAVLLAVDLISKKVAFDFLDNRGGSYVVFDGIFNLVRVENDGASFGIFSGKVGALSAFTAVTMAVLAGILVWRPKSPKLFRAGIICIIAGGIGNLVDRIAFKYVRDFIDYAFLKTFFNIDNFGVGNVADIFVLVGLLCVVVYVFFGYKEGDFAKDPSHSDSLPDALVVDEGEEKKPENKEEKEGVTPDASPVEEEERDNLSSESGAKPRKKSLGKDNAGGETD